MVKTVQFMAIVLAAAHIVALLLFPNGHLFIEKANDVNDISHLSQLKLFYVDDSFGFYRAVEDDGYIVYRIYTEDGQIIDGSLPQFISPRLRYDRWAMMFNKLSETKAGGIPLFNELMDSMAGKPLRMEIYAAYRNDYLPRPKQFSLVKIADYDGLRKVWSDE